MPAGRKVEVFVRRSDKVENASRRGRRNEDIVLAGKHQHRRANVAETRDLPAHVDLAICQARALAEAGYAPPARPNALPVAGRTGIANCEMALVNMRAGNLISDHDYRVARAAAVALCGGEVESGSLVSEQWLLDIERREFVALLKTPETQARIAHMLETGKPLRN